MRTKVPSRSGCAWLAGLLCLLAGCGQKPAAPRPVYPVHGRVTSKGAPADRVRVVFFSTGTPAPGNNPAAWTDADGRFELSTLSPKDGAPEGEYVVTLYWPAVPFETLADGAPMPKDKFGNAYAKPSVTKLRARVEPKSNEINFDLP